MQAAGSSGSTIKLKGCSAVLTFQAGMNVKERVCQLTCQASASVAEPSAPGSLSKSSSPVLMPSFLARAGSRAARWKPLWAARNSSPAVQMASCIKTRS